MLISNNLCTFVTQKIFIINYQKFKKMKRVLIYTCLFFTFTFYSCEEEKNIVNSVIQGKITYEEGDSGWEGDAKNATVKLHIGQEEGAVQEVTANETGFYIFPKITVNLDSALTDYTVSAEFRMQIGGTPIIFTGRSEVVTPKGKDTIVCNLHLIK